MPNDLIIAVISDTHNHLPEALVDRLSPAEEIWHLDDVCRPETLEKLDELPADRFTFQGNNDPYFHWEERLTLERNGLCFQLQHLPHQSIPPKLTAILFGHLHYPIKEDLGRAWTLNPGVITGPRKQSQSSFAWLRISSVGDWTWELETL
ncbi:MAG: metallophosphoesterase family protein [Opitutales bacterium]|jgi:putative phosphoesterase|nr:metallophosphoesterase family protein [Opitutales bacterium]MDG2253542.1 metallophosphoesterase family protein [Opitutaceae bacterium]MBT5168393.1 metallophosphoesterase family protein [Opitutales bacterium]MBT5816661.1 metallophosphoesterase family protein [Opitutales bacterium]MBT6380629.1 metallophosphoesterase family protein [Opitutales bacterium]